METDWAKKNDLQSKGVKKKIGEELSVSLNDIKEKYKGTQSDTEELILSIDESFDEYKQAYNESIKIVYPNVTPIGSDIITTAMLYNVDKIGHQLIGNDFDIDMINQFKNNVSDVQVVVAIGPDTRQVKVGDTVKYNISNFTRMKNPNSVHSLETIEIPLHRINGKDYLIIPERSCHYVIND
jgi:hypothetical protein